MTWRAFFVGLLAVILIAAITPYNDFDIGNTYITGCHFPPGPFFILLILTVVANLLIKLVRKEWALRQGELLLVWCMMIVSATVPSSGLMRFLPSMQVAPAYYARSPDLPHQDKVLDAMPDSLVVSKNFSSVPAGDFFQGQAGQAEVRIYLQRWIRPMLTWLVFIFLFYFATFFLGGILRKQWVEIERLIFPLARVPMELTEGSSRRELMPALMRNRAFLVGLVLSLAFAVVRGGPVLFGAEQGWLPTVPIQSVLAETPLGQTNMGTAYLFPIAVGVAFLVPADVALSVWLFFVFTRLEFQASHWMGTPITGGTWGKWMAWQQAGAFIVFTVMMFWAARRHLKTVVRKALFLDRDIDDSEEPISYTVGFWGLVAALGGMVAWFWWFGMNPVTAVALLALVMAVALIHARLISQGGIFFTQHTWTPPTLLHSVTGGAAFGAPAAVVVAQMQNAILIQDSREILSGHAFNALRISSVFKRHKRWFLPIMFVALAVAVGVCTIFTLRMYYRVGGYNIPNTYGTISLPKQTFQAAGRIIANPTRSAEPLWFPLGLGGVVMLFVTVMRARFYWWPVHSLGFLIGSTWPAHNLWFSFFLAWLAKVFIMKFGGGTMLKKARNFFLGAIIGEFIAIGVTTLLGLLVGMKFGYLFLPG